LFIKFFWKACKPIVCGLFALWNFNQSIAKGSGLTVACKFSLASKDSIVGLPLLQDIDKIKSIRGPVHFVCLSRPLKGPIQVAVYLADYSHVVASPASQIPVDEELVQDGSRIGVIDPPPGLYPRFRIQHLNKVRYV
jgi:hypothetical protein